MALLFTGRQLQDQPAMREKIGRMRHEFFIEELKWELESRDGLEFDQFDTENTVYIVYEEQGQIIGCLRILPTTEPYLLSEVFPHLAGGYIPSAPHVWEISRYVIDKTLIRSPQHWLEVSAQLVCGLYEYAAFKGITEFVIEIPPALFDKSSTLYGCPFKVLPPQKYGSEWVQVCHYRPSLKDHHRNASEWAGLNTPVIAPEHMDYFENTILRAAE